MATAGRRAAPKVAGMRHRVPGLAFYALMALVVAVIGHNLVFLLTYGSDYSLALARTGHDGRWGETARAILAAGVALALAASLRLVHLNRLVEGLRAGGAGSLSGRSYARTVLSLWARLYLASTLLFVVQENYERWAVGVGLPGLSVLGPIGYTGPLAAFLVVSLLVASVAGLFKWGISALEARVAATRSRVDHVVRQAIPLSTDSDRPAISFLWRDGAGRAPPDPLPA